VLQYLKVRNFQSLRELEIALGKFTVIFGESDVGKSAVIRSVRAAVNNQAGQDFISHGETTACVTLELDSATVEWSKGKSAVYSLDKPSALIERFEKMGRAVPEEISEVLKIGPESFGDQEFDINIHTQMEPPFLLNESPATRAKVLGELSGVNILYRAIQECRRRLQEVKRNQTIRLGDFEKAKAELDSYRYLAAVSKELNEAEKLSESAKSVSDELSSLNSSISYLQSLSEKVSFANRAMEASSAVQAKILSLKQSQEQLIEIGHCIDGLENSAGLMRTYSETVNNLTSQVEFVKENLGDMQRCPTCGQSTEHLYEPNVFFDVSKI
jgi:exonuclease SbcC